MNEHGGEVWMWPPPPIPGDLMKEPRTVELKETRLLLAVLAQAVSEYTEGYAEASDERRRELWARMVDVERKAWEYIRVHPETS